MHPYLRLICTVPTRYIQNRFLWHLSHHFPCHFHNERKMMFSPGIVERGDAVCKRHCKNSSNWSPLCCDSASLFPRCALFQNKDINSVFCLKSEFLYPKYSVNFLWLLVGCLGNFQKQLTKEKLHEYFILFTALNQGLC